jgi:peptide/nickel transport system substrate-binding protein
MNRRTLLGSLALALTLFCAGQPAQAQKSADTLRIVLRDGVPNIDPYYNNLRTGLILAHHGWDTLVFRNPGRSNSSRRSRPTGSSSTQ